MKILITGGPTNEFIDEVMKITNMSTGSMPVRLAKLFEAAGDEVCFIVNKGVHTEGLSCRMHKIETTEDMYRALEQESVNHYDAVIHASAVGDYKPQFSFLLEDLAQELYEKSRNGGFSSAQEILAVLEKPDCIVDDSSKISSYQKNLTVKLGLTPKLISYLRRWYPDAVLIGFKLLENVSKQELVEVAAKLCHKNDMDYIMANDLARLRDGKSTRHLVTKEGYTGIDLETPDDIFAFVKEQLENRR